MRDFGSNLKAMEVTMDDSSKRGLSATKTRSSGMKGGKNMGKRTRATAVKGKPGPKLPGEKSVRETKATVDVKPLKMTREARSPLDTKAVDRRKQVFDDMKPGRSR
jgi:hypothetical protein